MAIAWLRALPLQKKKPLRWRRVLLQYFFAARLRSWLGNILITTFRKLSLTSRKAEIPEYSPPALSNSRGIIVRKRRLSSVVGTKAALWIIYSNNNEARPETLPEFQRKQHQGQEELVTPSLHILYYHYFFGLLCFHFVYQFCSVVFLDKCIKISFSFSCIFGL